MYYVQSFNPYLNRWTQYGYGHKSKGVANSIAAKLGGRVIRINSPKIRVR